MSEFDSSPAALASLVLAKGPGWLAIDKPDWMSVHNAGEHSIDALACARAILDSDSALRAFVDAEPGFGPAPAHRLDVGVSGVLVLAVSRDGARRWAATLPQTNKIYVALARGPGIASSVDWNWPLTDRAEGRRDPQGPRTLRKECVTHVRPLGALSTGSVSPAQKWFSTFEAELGTGRTHQIRRHAALARVPLLGDRRYAEAKHADMLVERYGFARLGLHARRLIAPTAQANGLSIKPLQIESAVPLSFTNILHAANVSATS